MGSVGGEHQLAEDFKEEREVADCLFRCLLYRLLRTFEHSHAHHSTDGGSDFSL